MKNTMKICGIRNPVNIVWKILLMCVQSEYRRTTFTTRNPASNERSILTIL